MRVMEIVSGTSVNGAVVNCLEISRGLRDLGHAVHFVCRPKSWIARQVASEAGISLIECDLKRRPDRLKAIAEIIRQRRIELVHTHMSSANFFGILLRRLWGAPCVVATAHNRNIQLHWMFNDRVIAVSEATRAYHRTVNQVRGNRIDVVHNFVDPDRFATITLESATSLRGELGIPIDARLIGVIGDVVPRKGQAHLLRAMPTILRHVPNAHLICVGHWMDGFIAHFRQTAERLGIEDRVTWSDVRDDIGRVLKMLDLFVLPSLEENLPLTILEAMASELPIVASSVGGIPECVLDGKTGLLVPPGDEASLARAVARILSDKQLAASMASAGRERVIREFSLSSQIQRVEDALQRALRGRTRSSSAAA